MLHACGGFELCSPCGNCVGWRYAYPTYKKLVFNHLCILFGEKIHQRPDRWQQAAPGRIHRMDHFPVVTRRGVK